VLKYSPVEFSLEWQASTLQSINATSTGKWWQSCQPATKLNARLGSTLHLNRSISTGRPTDRPAAVLIRLFTACRRQLFSAKLDARMRIQPVPENMRWTLRQAKMRFYSACTPEIKISSATLRVRQQTAYTLAVNCSLRLRSIDSRALFAHIIIIIINTQRSTRIFRTMWNRLPWRQQRYEQRA
jgi:hypothetical protein